MYSFVVSIKKEMKITVFLILTVIIFPYAVYTQVNNTGSDGLKQGRWQKNYPNGNPMYEGYYKDGKPTGEWTRYYEGGQVKAKIEYDQNSDSAFTVLFDQWGKRIAEGVYLDEKKEGKWIFFSDHVKISEENYKKGLKHWISRTYYPTGEVLEETEWQNGRQEGNYRLLFHNGKPYLQCKYSDGKRNGLCLSYFQNGRVEMEAWYSNNLRQNEWKFYNEKGQYLYSLRFDNGKLLNPEVRDSIDNHNLNQFEKNKTRIADPEDFMQNPTDRKSVV